MATQAATPASPRYAIGAYIYRPFTDYTTEKLPCPDCLDTGQWTATSPAGETFTLGCPRCGQYTYHDLPSLRVARHRGHALPLVICGYEVREDGRVEYRAREPGTSGGWYTVAEQDVILDQTAAQTIADLLAASANAKQETHPETLKARHFAGMRLDAAQFDQFQNGLWAAHYHAANLIERVRWSLFGTDDRDAEDTQAPEQVVADLRDAARNDFDYHIDAMPLAPLIRAAANSSDEAVTEALAKVPVPMVEMFTKPVLPEPGAGLA